LFRRKRWEEYTAKLFPFIKRLKACRRVFVFYYDGENTERIYNEKEVKITTAIIEKVVG